MRRLVGGMLATVFASSVMYAQDVSTCAAKLETATPDSVRSTFAATVQSFNPRRPLPTTFGELLGEGLQQELKLPPDLVLPIFEADSIESKAAAGQKAWMAVPSMSVVLGVTIEAGKITRIRRIAGSSGITFDAAVAQALMALDSSSALPPLPQEIGPDPLEISVAIMRVPARELHPAITSPGVAVTPLFRVLSPAHVVAQRIQPGADFSKFRPQPPTKRDDEAVIVRISVMPDGLVDLGTMQVLAYSSTGYIRSVFDMLPNWKFQPMILSGCAVPAIEELTFTAGQKSTTSP